MAYPAMIAQEECVLQELHTAAATAKKVELTADECIAHPQTADNVEELIGDFVDQHFYDLMEGLAKV